MATYLENLTTARDNYAAAIASFSIDLAAGKHKPTYTVDGQTVAWNRYQEVLLTIIDRLNARIDAADDPFYVEDTQGYVVPPYGLHD